MAKNNILKESLIDARELKLAAIRNAQNSLAEHFRESLEEMVSAELNEESDMDTGDEPCEELEETHMEFDPGNLVMSEEEDLFGEEEGDEMLEDEGLGEEEAEGEDLDLELESVGFSETDLQEAIREILDEVDHGQLGEMEDVDPDTHSTGLMDKDSKEDGWQNKTVPAKKDWTVKEAYEKMKRMNARLVAENKSLKKGMAKLRESVEQTNLFNKKLYLVHKLINKRNLTESLKKKIVSTLDEAKTSREAERIYESFESVLGVMSEGRKTPSRKTSTLTEALGSQRNEKGVTHIDDAHLINEGAQYEKHRMMKLAGLRRNEE